jgi:DNA-directed RNA polymerase specialized sigma24 family protein
MYNPCTDTCRGGGLISRTRLKPDWVLSAESFQRFLVWLDAGAGTPGERYLEMRRRLADYFDRKQCARADELSDETLNRVARRLEEEGAIDAATPAQYCYVVARFVFFEYLRRGDRGAVPYDEMPSPDSKSPALQVADDHEPETQDGTRRFECLEQCLDRLPAAERSLILAYYSGEQRLKIEQRRALAARFGFTPNALAIRACRIRSKLEECVSGCVGKD